MPSVDQLIVWAVVGLLGGSIASLVVTWSRTGFGRWRNFALGLIGALVGGFIFRIFGLFPSLFGLALVFGCDVKHPRTRLGIAKRLRSCTAFFGAGTILLTERL
jgi:uncharacterized membrane protein YeaQ/YmgE (transglycosylase-associated protein family)